MRSALSGTASSDRLAPSPDVTFMTGLPSVTEEDAEITASQPQPPKRLPASHRAPTPLAQKVQHVIEFLGLSPGMPALQAVEEANRVMGVEARGSLPAQVDALLLACLGTR